MEPTAPPDDNSRRDRTYSIALAVLAGFLLMAILGQSSMMNRPGIENFGRSPGGWEAMTDRDLVERNDFSRIKSSPTVISRPLEFLAITRAH